MPVRVSTQRRSHRIEGEQVKMSIGSNPGESLIGQWPALQGREHRKVRVRKFETQLHVRAWLREHFLAAQVERVELARLFA